VYVTHSASRAPHKKNTVGSQVQNVFVKHFVCVFLAILFISMIEEVPLAVDPNYSLFKIIFEVVSAYGTATRILTTAHAARLTS
jgi:Trk-type K+ transport system membrane component